MTTASDAPSLVLPYARSALRRKAGPVGRLAVGPWLPLIVKVVLDVVVALTAPYLLPLLPLVDRFVDWALSSGSVTPAQAADVRSFLALYRDAHASVSPEVRTAVAERDQDPE